VRRILFIRIGTCGNWTLTLHALFLVRLKCDPLEALKCWHNVLGGGHISQSLALFEP
jgi:hypothetical protein